VFLRSALTEEQLLHSNAFHKMTGAQYNEPNKNNKQEICFSRHFLMYIRATILSGVVVFEFNENNVLQFLL
jgi:hypothetical protein